MRQTAGPAGSELQLRLTSRTGSHRCRLAKVSDLAGKVLHAVDDLWIPSHQDSPSLGRKGMAKQSASAMACSAFRPATARIADSLRNTIEDVPWSGIAIGGGWGLLDPSGFPSLPNATAHQWGQWETPTPNRNGLVAENTIRELLGLLWDGGAIYTTGAQGTSMENGLRIEANVARSGQELI